MNSNQTTVNPSTAQTELNISLGGITVINPHIPLSSNNLIEKTVLGGKYLITAPLDVKTGEADLYLCTYNKNTYVAKIYRRKQAIKPEVVSTLKSVESEHIAKIIDSGIYQKRPFEILPYYVNGSLSGKKFTFEELKSNIIPCINKALYAIHSKNLLHKDIKPSNIMLSNDKKGVALIDFGISSVVDTGNTVLITKTGMTPEYSAPETFRNLFLEESDYYSFGITLYELYCGYTPYANMNAEQIARYTAVQRIPFPDDMPNELKDLISALTYFDITNRNNKDNPNRRWTFHEVESWCKDEKQVIPGEGMGFAPDTIPPYIFMGKEYTSIPKLVTALATHWEKGKEQLFKGHLSSFFKGFNPGISKHCSEAENEATKSILKDDFIFRKLLYKIYPELNGFYWMGQIYESLPALGRDMLERLWKTDSSNHSFWDSILTNRLMSEYLSNQTESTSELLTAVTALEDSHCIPNKNKRDCLMNYYTMAYLLSGQKYFNVNGKQISSVSDLVTYMQSLLNSSYREFEDFCHKLIDYNDVLDVQLESWLIAIGKRNQLEIWRNQLSQ